MDVPVTNQPTIWNDQRLFFSYSTGSMARPSCSHHGTSEMLCLRAVPGREIPAEKWRISWDNPGRKWRFEYWKMGKSSISIGDCSSPKSAGNLSMIWNGLSGNLWFGMVLGELLWPQDWMGVSGVNFPSSMLKNHEGKSGIHKDIIEIEPLWQLIISIWYSTCTNKRYEPILPTVNSHSAVMFMKNTLQVVSTPGSSDLTTRIVCEISNRFLVVT